MILTVCTICPKGCRLSVDTENDCIVSGNACTRGETYGKTEALKPVRTITSTVCIEGAAYRRCPIRSDSAMPKNLIFEAMRTLETICLYAPVHTGQVILENVCGTSVNFIATRDMLLSSENLSGNIIEKSAKK